MARPRQYTPDEDAPLILLAQQGDFASFETLVWKYLKRIYNLAYLLSGDGTIATEAARRSFVTAYQEIRSLRSTTRFSSWLVVLMLREYGGLLVFGELGGGTPGAAAAPREGVPREIPGEDSPLMQSLRGYIRSLAPEQGVVLVLHYVRGYRLERLVEILQLNEDFILSRLFTAQMQLASLLKKGGAVAGRLEVEVSNPHLEIRRHFPAYLDNSATEKEKEVIRRHLAECGGCREALAELEWIAEHLKSLSDLEPPAWLGPAIMEAVRTEILPAPPPPAVYNPFSRRRRVVVLIIAAVALFWYLAPRENGNGQPAKAPAPAETAKAPAAGGEGAGGEGAGAPLLPSLPRRYEGSGGGGAVPTRPQTPAVPAMPAPMPTPAVPAPAQPLRQTPPAVQQAVKPARPRAEMPTPLPAEWGDSLGSEQITPRKGGVARGRSGETSVLLGTGGRELSPVEIERAVTAQGGTITGRGYSDGRDILYTSIDVERVMELMTVLGKIGTIQELPHVPEGVTGTIDLVIRW